MKSYVSSFSGSWFQRCLSMVLCFCMVLSLCPLPQHAAASEVEEGQEVSQPVETQPAPQPVETQPAPQPVETQPAPQPVETQPAPQPVETQPAPQPEQTQPVTQPEETQPVTQPEETQEVTQPEETQEVTQPEETQEVTEPEETQEVTQPVETQEVTEPEETQEVTEPEETQETTEPEETQEVQPLVVTGWQWVDEEGYINPETNELLINFASAEQLVTAEDLLFVLPYEILATVDGEAVQLPLGEWKCDDYPTAGAYQGEYVFKTTLPEGYVLAEDAAELKITVVFDSIASTLEEEHTHIFDANGVCECGAVQVRYLDASHAVQTAVCQAVTAETTELTDGWYVAQGNVTIGGSVTATENANLILADGCSLTVGGDFLIQGGKSLNIYVQSGGTGSLTISGSTGLDISGSGDVSVGIYGGRIVVNASIGSEEWRMTLSSSAGSSAVIYCGGFGGNVDYYNGFCGVIVVQEYQEIWVYDSCTLCFDIVVPQGSKYMEVDEAFLTFTNGAKLQVPEGSSLRLYGLGSFPNGIAANVDLRTILDDYCAFQDSSGSIIKLSGETSLPGPVTLVDKHKCSWQYKDSTAEGHTRYCDECGRSFIEPHRGDMEQGMEKTDINHTYTCGCGAEVTEAHQWEYFYSDANQHEKYCPVCGKSEDIPHDFTSGDCVCGAVQVSYADATGAEQGTAGCIRLNSIDEEEFRNSRLSGWYLVENEAACDVIGTEGSINLILANGCSLNIDSIYNGGKMTIWQQTAEAGKATGKLVLSGPDFAIGGSYVTIKGGVLELSGTERAFEYVPTIGSCMKLSVSDGNGGYTPVNIGERTSQLSTATKLKLEPCTDHVWGGADDNEYIDSSYHGVRCQYCGIGGDRKEAHSFDAGGFCSCGAVQFLDASGNQAVQYCQVLSGETTYYGDISSGWYVVKGDFDFQGTMSGTVNLVLANGSKLYNSGDEWDHKIQLDKNANLTVYAQSTDPSVMGNLVSTYTSQYGLRASSITFNGGNIYVEGMDWAVSGRFTVNGGIVELRATNDNGYVSYGMPSVPVGMRITIVKDEGNVLVTDREGDWSKQQHVIIQPCTDHSVTKGSTYIDDNTHTLMCAYCDVLLEGTGKHDFGTNGVCNCGLVQYLDENGETQSQLCQKFTGGMENGGWYVLDKDYSVWGFWVEKDANLILAKGVTLNSDVTLYGCTLTVYGQPGSVLNLGNLDTGGDSGSSLSILGGVTQISTVNNYQPLTLTVNGGILSVDTIEYDDEPVTVNNQRGIYLESGVGQVAGNFTLSQSFTLEDGQILTIPENAKLTVASPKTRSTSYLVNNGKIYVDGALSGDVSGSGEVYYLVKLPEGVTAKLEDGSNLESYNEKLYAKAGQKIVLTGGTSESYLANGSCVYGATFTMGAEVTEVEVHSHSFNNNDGFCSSCDAYQEPDQDDSGVFQIANAGNLFWFANYCNESAGPRSARLLNPIVIPEKADGSKRDWTPIGTSSLPYTGSFDGQGFTISGLYFNDSAANYVGLFGYVNLVNTGDIIQNVTVEGEFTGKYNVGGICGHLQSGTIRNCQNLASVKAVQAPGGICGKSEGNIERCHNSGTITGNAASGRSGTWAGGICGFLTYGATIGYCSNSGIVTGTGYCVGGIAGGNTTSWYGQLTDCWNSGSIGGGNTTDVGGIIGGQSNSPGTVANCYSYGTVSTANNYGPICSYSYSTPTNCFYQSNTETDSFDGTTAKTAEEFASGEVAYLLNAGRTPAVWGQNLAEGSADAYPVLNGAPVAATKKCDGTAISYQNADSDVTLPHDVNETGKCSICNKQFPVSATIDGVTSYYETFLEASTQVYLSGNGTLTLLADVVNTDVTAGILTINGTFNLDLNGKTLNVNTDIYVVQSDTDPVLNVQGPGSLNLETGKKLYVQSGKVNIQGGEIIGDIRADGGALNISGGKFTGKIEVYNSATYSITGGEFVNLSNVPGSASSNMQLYQLPAEGYWFYSTRTGEEGNYTYSDPVQFGDITSLEYSYNGSLYVGPHSHDFVFTSIDSDYHDCECTGCLREYFDGHTDADSDGLCDVCGTIEVHYKDVDGRDRTQRCFPITADTKELTTSPLAWYVVKDAGLLVENRITVNGSVNLILMDGKDLTVNGGIEVGSGQSLTIWSQSNGTGSLTCQNCDYDAGIGSTKNDPCGTVIINGGKISSYGGGNTAGIGGRIVEKVEINSGDVFAFGGEHGAGIGGSGNTKICINGGTVYARGGLRGAGIGGNASSDGGTIEIKGGYVTALGNYGSASIGGGHYENGDSQKKLGNAGNITISNATVVATSIGDTCGIGGPGNGGSLIISDNSVVFAPAIKLTNDQANWNGIVFIANEGKVYGNVTLSSDLVIPAGKNMTLDMNGNSLTLDGAKINLGENSSLKLSGNGSFPNGVSVTGGYLLDILADGWAFFYDIEGNDIVSLSSDTRFIVDDPSEPTVYLRPHVHSWVITGFDQYSHAKTCTCMTGSVEENHTEGDFCDICGAGMVSYLDETEKLQRQLCIALTDSSTTLGTAGEETWYVVKDNRVEISDRIELSGDVNLILADGCLLNATKGIHVPEGSSLTIWCQQEKTGMLDASGADGAGIGGNENNYKPDVDSTTGSITINGGNITAYGGWGDAAIGAFNGSSGSVTINGGSVNAFGGGPAAETNRWGGAGIGGGLYCGAGTIQINGGTVYAVGAEAAAGIGGGGSGYGGSVEITGGHVTAIGGSENTSYSFGLNGIGSGGSDDIPVTIKGGTVICVAGNTTEGYAGKAYKSAPTIDSGYGSYKVTVAGTLEGLADGSPVGYANRTGAFTGNAAVKLEPCKNHSRICEDKEDGIHHDYLCQYCGKIEGIEKHTAPDGEGRCPDCGALIVASMTANGSTGYYSEFLPAFSAANGISGSTLKLLANVYAERMLKVTGSFTLDLNGKTLKSDYFEYGNQYGDMWNDEGAIYVYGGSLTIQDSSEDKTGKIFLEPNPDLGDDFKNAISVRGGTLNFFGGKVNYRIRNELGTLNISGTAVVEVGSDDTAVRNINYQYSYQKAHATISGGTLIGGDCISAEGYTEVAITGGTFEALAGDYKSCVYCDSDSSVTVSGGTFTKQQGDKVYTFRGNNISVSGGEFIDGISVFGGNLKDRLATDENGEIAYWYYQKLEDGVYSDGITAADAAAASYGSTVYVGCHEHDYVSYGDGTCVCGKQIPVAVSIGGETQFFDSLSAAMASLDTSAEEKAQVTVFQSTSFQNDLVIPENVTLTVKDGATLTAENNARLFVRSSLSGSVSGDVRYLVSVNTNEVNVTGRSVTVYLGSVYARADDPINLKAINYDADSMMLTDWLVDNVSSSESFTMPSHPVTIERKLEAIVATVTIQGETTPYPNLYEAFDAVNDADDKVIIELKADAKLDHGTIRLDNRYCNVIFSGGSYKIYGEEPGDWEHRSGYIGVLSGADLTIESGTIASSAFLHCGSGSSVTVTNGSIDTLIVEGGKLTVEPAVDEENNPVGNIRVENLEVMGFSVGDVQLKGGSYGTITVPGGKYVSDLLAEGYAYKLTDGSWEDANNGTYTEAISAATVLPVPVTIIAQPDATKTMTYGDVESLSVTANREEASYQWYEVIPDTSETAQAKAITGETGSTLKLSTFNAGTHEFFCEATVDGYNAKSSPATVTVNPRTLDIQWDGNTFQYDGQYHPKFTIGNTANGDQVFPVLQSGNEPQKNVGSYTVIVTNFVANGTDGFNKHGNYKLGGTTYQDFSITAKPITVNITAIGGTYGGAITGATAELVGVVAGETVPVTLTYTSGSGYNSTTAPTDAGTYTVTATIKDRNYQLTGTTTAKFVVKKATNSWTTEPSVSDWTYGDSSTVDPGAASFGTVQVTYYQGETKLTAAPTNAGSYKVCFDVEGTSNYSALHEEKTFTIEKRQLSIASAVGYERSYDGTNAFRVHSFTYENMIEGDKVHIGSPDNGHLVTVSSANVGTYDKATLPDDLALTGDDADNYTLVKPTGPVDTEMTISPKEVTFSGITAKDKDYDATTQVTLDYSGLQISGLIDGDDLSVSVTAAFTDANAGQNKTVAFTNPVLTGNSAGNYVLKETGNQTSTTATIYPLEISIVDVTVEGKVYDGTKDATITNIGRLSTNYDGDKLTIVPGTASFETANAGNGKTVSFQGFELSGSAKDNYKLIGQPAPTTANITPATVAALTLKASSTTYDGNAKVPVIVAVTSENDLTLTGSDYQVSYQDADGNTVTELKNAGTYTVTVTGNGNFQGTATADFTIDRANAASTTAPKANTLTYNGQAQALVTAGSTNDGTMVYSTTENGTYSVDIPTGTDAGSYEVWYMVRGDSNHLSTDPVKLTPSIAQKSIAGAEITLGAELTYNGEEQEQSVESVKIDGLDVTYTVSKNTGTNAGPYKLTVTGNGNFTGTKDMAWSIAKKSIADAEITLGDALTYNGKLQIQSIASVKVDGLTVPAESYVASGNTGTNAGEYTLTVNAKGNFTDSKDMAWSIAKKSIADAEITLGAQLTYNGNPQRQSITSVKIDGLNVTYDASGDVNTNAGSYTLTVTGKGNFQGTATASYSIAKAKPTVTPAQLTITYGTKLSGCDLSGFKASFGGKELPGSFAFDQPDTMPHVSDSGTTSYKLTFTPDDTVNFEKVQLETKVTVNKKELTVNVAVQDKQYNGTSEAFFVDGTPTLVGVVTGDKVELTYGDPYFTDVAENKDIAISFTEAFAITGDDSGNYYLTQPTGITASIFNSFTAAKGENGSYTVNTNEWTNQDFVVTAQNGSKLSIDSSADGSWSDTLTVTTEGEGDLKFYVRRADGAISKQASEHYKLDKTAPTGSIFFDETDQTAGTTPVVLYRNAAVNAGITGNDDRSGVKDLAWAASKQAQEPSSITDWNTAASFQLTPEDGTERHVYLKVVDNAGNVAYFRANTILFDTTKPSITGVDDGETYYTTQTAAVSDDYLDAVTLNGAAVTLNEDGKTASVKLTGNVDKTYIIKATDKAGNESTVTVIMKPISSITDPVKDLTKDNVTEDDRKTLDELTGILEDLLEPTTDQTEKQKLQDELDKLQKLLDVLDKVKEVEELLRDLPDDVEPDVDADTEQKIKDARKALDDLTDHQEDLVEDDLIEKLERLENELVDYKFLEGDGSTWNRGSGKAARFVGNGRLDKLDKVILDGTELTTGFTKNTPKTTIDLQAAFLQSLELGEHTLKLVYTDGEAEAKFTVKQSPNYLDLTGNPDFDDQTEVDVGGERYPIEEIGARYVNLPESGDLLTTYTYLAGNAAGTHDNYPIGMRVFRINRSEDGTTVTEITEFADLLQYSGCSIRVSGKRGIRMITSMTKSNKAALKGKGLAGFTMLEYGTVVQWADTLGSDDLTLNSGNHNYAYKRDVADPVFGTSGGLTQYTNVLVGFDLEECSKDIVMRPYIILQDAEGNQYTLYGGLVTRSISYIAWQNRDTYKPGTAAYKYVHELMGDLDTPAEGG